MGLGELILIGIVGLLAFGLLSVVRAVRGGASLRAPGWAATLPSAPAAGEEVGRVERLEAQVEQLHGVVEDVSGLATEMSAALQRMSAIVERIEREQHSLRAALAEQSAAGGGGPGALPGDGRRNL